MEKTKKTEVIKKVAPKTDSSKFYELGYLLLPTLSVDESVKEMDKMGEWFTSRGGEFVSGEMPVMIDLAYPMVKIIHAHRQKCETAYFGWMKFEIETEKIAEIKNALDQSETVLRYLIVKTVRENTLINGAMKLGKMKEVEEDEVHKPEGEETPAPVDIEEIDKSIDDLVIA